MAQVTQNSQPPNTPCFQIPDYVLDDLCSRFIINIPEEERQDLIRMFFQIELAHWFYLDFYCAENQELKTCGIKDFSAQIFHHCPSLSGHAQEVDKILGNWKSYKMSVPTYGAIMLDPEMKYCLLVQGFWAKASWGFPKGKVNENEQPWDCAIREVFEETGFDVSGLIDREMYLENKMNDQVTRLYIIQGVPLDTKFQPKTRKEIKSLQWFPLDSLPVHKRDTTPKTQLSLNPNTFFMVIPFVKLLRKWVSNTQNPHGSGPMAMTGQVTTRPPSARSSRAGTMDSGNHGNASYKLYSNSHANKINSSNKEFDTANSGNGKQPYRDKLAQKQRQQQYFSQGNQSEYQDYMQFKDTKTRAREARERKQREKSESDKWSQSQGYGTQGQGQGYVGQGYGSPMMKSDKKQQPQFHILKRDGSVGKPRRSLATQFDNQGPGASPGGKYGVSNTDRRQKRQPQQQQQYQQENSGPIPIDKYIPPSWRNFKFDVEAIMACF